MPKNTVSFFSVFKESKTKDKVKDAVSNILTENEVIDLLKNKVGNKFFSCEFIKKDGTIRQLTGKMGAQNIAKKRNKTGKHRKENKNPKRITVLDVNKIEDDERGQFRTIPVDRLIWVKYNGIKYNIRHDDSIKFSDLSKKQKKKVKEYFDCHFYI